MVAAERHQDPAVYAVTDKPVAVLGKLTVGAITEQPTASVPSPSTTKYMPLLESFEC